MRKFLHNKPISPILCTLVCAVLLPLLFSGCATSRPDKSWAQDAQKENSPVLFVANTPPLRGQDSTAAIQAAATYFCPAAAQPDLDQSVSEYAESLKLWSQTMDRDWDILAERLAAGVPVLLKLRNDNTPGYGFHLAVGLNSRTGALLLRGEGQDFITLQASELKRRWPAHQSLLVLCPPERASWPLSVADYISRASLYERRGRNGEAIRDLQAALAKSPEEPTALIRLGNLRRIEKDFDGAEALYRQALASDPDNAAACNNLAYLLAEQNLRLTEAERLALRAIQLQPGNPRMSDTLGVVYLTRKQYEKAIRLLERARAQAANFPTPTRASISEHLALAYHRSGQAHLVRQVITDLLTFSPGHKLPEELDAYH